MDTTASWSLRAATVDDRAAIVEVIAASNVYDGVELAITLDEVEQSLDDAMVVLATDVRVAVDDVTGGVVGYVNTFHIPSDVAEERCYLSGTVLPAWRRRGIGRALMAWAIERAEQQLRTATHSLPKYIRVDEYDIREDAHRLYERCGFVTVRWFEDLLRPLDDLPAEPARDAIAGLRIIPWPAERTEEIRVEKNAAFADHWGSTPTSVAMWEDMTTGHGSFPSCSFVAVDADDRVVAHCWTERYPEDDEVVGRREAVISSLGTLREWRGRGVASALMAASLHAFARNGLTHALIGVDADNPSGAHRLYRGLGFEPLRRTTTHQIEVAAD